MQKKALPFAVTLLLSPVSVFAGQLSQIELITQYGKTVECIETAANAFKDDLVTSAKFVANVVAHQCAAKDWYFDENDNIAFENFENLALAAGWYVLTSRRDSR